MSFNFLAISTFTVYFVAALTMDLSGLAWYGYVIINIELIFGLYIALSIYQSGLFFSMTVFGSSAYAGHIYQTNQKTLKHINECRFNMPLCSYVLWRNRSIIKNQLQEHNIATTLVISGSRNLFGKILYVFLLINIPINVYLIRRNLYRQQDFIDKLMLSLIAFFSIACIIDCLLTTSLWLINKTFNKQFLCSSFQCWIL